VIPHEDSVFDPEELGGLASAHRVSHLLALPALYSLILNNVPAKLLSSLRLAIVAGEACPVELVTHHDHCCPSTALFNEYGPTEATVWSSVARCEVRDQVQRVPIGNPITNAQIYVIDYRLNPVPIGVKGELYIAGKGLARGYLGRPKLTAERFIPDPFAPTPGSRLYKTGDLGTLLLNGNIDFLGRNDFQVKIRGMRIELGEIESILRRHDNIRDAVVILIGAPQPHDKRLVAYLVEKAAGTTSPKQLKDYLKHKLPDYMVPGDFVFMDQLPLTPSGKVNRLALPPPDSSDSEDLYEEPQGPVEKVIAGIWEEVLGRKRVGASDNFFEIGGHSLIATQVISRVKEVLGVEVSLRQLFEEPTVRGLAQAITAPPETRARVERVAEIMLALRELSEEETRDILEARRVAASAKEQR
jgi:acyl carrier protein